MMKKQLPINNCRRNSAMGGHEWEMRPGGMLVQKRNLDSSNLQNSIQNSNPAIKIRVKYNSYLHEVQINPHSSFGELKKLLAAKTGLNPQDQKLVFKEKERDSKQFLDIVGVRDGSTMVLRADLLSQEKKFLEQRRNASFDQAKKSVTEVATEVNKLAAQVAQMERIIAVGKMVAEKEMLVLTELLMAQLIRLDGVVADGDIKLQRKKQVMRVQGYLETLDRLKAQNESIQQGKRLLRMGEKTTFLQRYQPQEEINVAGHVPRFTNFASQQFIVTSKWEKY